MAPALTVGTRLIGHGLNLIHEPGAVGRMLGEGVAVEVSMVSNQILGHVPGPAGHPARDLLRCGLPVCLSTDNPGVWGAQLTDEFYLAATAWDCPYSELAVMARASLEHCFAPPVVRRVLPRRHERALRAFE